MCEAFLGIEPHFEIFCFLFHLKPQPDSYDLDVVDGADLQLRQGKEKVYIPYKHSSKVIEWKPKWLYIENQWETLLAITPGPPTRRHEWNKKPVNNSQIPELLDRIAELRQRNTTGEVVVFYWLKRRIQPLQARETLGFQYQRISHPSRYLEEEISDEEIFSRVQRLLKNVKGVPFIPDTFSAANPPKKVRVKVVDS